MIGPSKFALLPTTRRSLRTPTPTKAKLKVSFESSPQTAAINLFPSSPVAESDPSSGRTETVKDAKIAMGAVSDVSPEISVQTLTNSKPADLGKRRGKFQLLTLLTPSMGIKTPLTPPSPLKALILRTLLQTPDSPTELVHKVIDIPIPVPEAAQVSTEPVPPLSVPVELHEVASLSESLSEDEQYIRSENVIGSGIKKAQRLKLLFSHLYSQLGAARRKAGVVAYHSLTADNMFEGKTSIVRSPAQESIEGKEFLERSTPPSPSAVRFEEPSSESSTPVTTPLSSAVVSEESSSEDSESDKDEEEEETMMSRFGGGLFDNGGLLFRKRHRRKSIGTPLLNVQVEAEPEEHGSGMKKKKSVAKLLGRKRIKFGKLLGRGAAGVVYLGTVKAKGLVHTVAVKQVLLEGMQDVDAFVGLLWLEAEMLGKFSHPYIVGYRGMYYSVQENMFNFILEFCEGGSLAGLIRKRGKLTPQEAAYVLAEVLEGLAYLHEHSVIHRDIKPSNVLLASGMCKIADFGCSTQALELARSCVGTPWYLAPEVARAEPYSYAADVWSLGCVALELVTGRRLWADLNAVAVIVRIAQDAPLPLPVAGLDDDVNDFIIKCLNHEWRKRPSARELLRHPFIARKEGLCSDWLLEQS